MATGNKFERRIVKNAGVLFSASGAISLTSSEWIPQANPLASYLAHKEEIDNAVLSALNGGHYILGEATREFESNLADYLGARHVIGTGSGTDALHLAFLCCGIGKEDVVITVSHTAVATAAAIQLVGASPAFVDVDPVSLTMSASSLEQAVPTLKKQFGSRLKAVVPVHLYGNPADMKSILKIANAHDLLVIEDCAQSHGAEIEGKKTGTWSDLSAFSFYPTKILAAIGDGGAVITSNPQIAERANVLREYGWKERYISSEYGMNTRLDEIQAAILNVKLKYVEEENVRRKQIASLYDSLLTGLPVQLPSNHSVYHQYVIRTIQRDALKSFLQEKSIGTAIHYPVPVHLQPAYREQAEVYRKDLVETERACEQILSLPIYPQLQNDQVIRVGEEIRSWFHRK
jgi:dTDP-4-amino-4,6-dideoxygalactose transaminase